MGYNIGLGKTTPYLALGGEIRPSEIDDVKQYIYSKPAVGDSAIVATIPGNVTTGTVTLAELDYPRNLSVKFVENSGTAWVCTVTVTGKNQFGEAITETFTNTNEGTVTVDGAKIFHSLSAVTAAHASGTAADDIAIGYCISAGTAKLGLFTKISKNTDVRRVTWVDNAVTKPGTVEVDTTYHAIIPSATVAAADDYVVWVKPNYAGNDDPVGNMGTSAFIS